jgi:hypothetical protein
VIHNFAEISHWTKVILVVKDADGSAISSQDLYLDITIKWVCSAGCDASFELDNKIDSDAYPGRFLGDDDNLDWPMACGR